MDEKLKQIQKLLDAAEGNLHSARNMLRETLGNTTEPLDVAAKAGELESTEVADTTIIEGIFNGEEMIAADSKNYPVPANYASKSKLVEGDGLKLTIAADGSFVYKQIKPIERRNIVGTLAQTDDGYAISAEGKNYKVLTASITFYKAEPGDTVTAIVPVGHDAAWAAMENIVTKAAEATTESTAEASSTEPTLPAEDSAVASTTEVSAEPAVVEAPLAAGEISIPEPPVNDEIQTPPITFPDSALSDSAAPLDVPDLTPVPTPEAVNDGTPDIVMPESSSGATLTDEQLLENLKANLQKIDPPATDMSAPAPVVPSANASLTSDKTDQPISELDI